MRSSGKNLLITTGIVHGRIALRPILKWTMKLLRGLKRSTILHAGAVRRQSELRKSLVPALCTESRLMESAKILLLSVATAVAYGIVQDQVTARVCVEYFTIGHPPV